MPHPAKTPQLEGGVCFSVTTMTSPFSTERVASLVSSAPAIPGPNAQRKDSRLRRRTDKIEKYFQFWGGFCQEPKVATSVP